MNQQLSAEDLKSLFRLLDANFNRALEGVRVCEDLFRFIRNDSSNMECLRQIRHALADVRKSLDQRQLLDGRESASDPGNRPFKDEMSRSTFDDLMSANLQRIKESLRVLEEGLKLLNPELSEAVKNLRFRVYEAEKKITV